MGIVASGKWGTKGLARGLSAGKPEGQVLTSREQWAGGNVITGHFVQTHGGGVDSISRLPWGQTLTYQVTVYK